MSRVVIDTNALLWFASDDTRLSVKARQAIASPDSTPLVSIASLWEIAIKLQIGKLILDIPFDQFLNVELSRIGIETLPISSSHLIHVSQLANQHRDPFDRLVAAQCLDEGLPVVSSDARFEKYRVQQIG